eukprot:594739-Rhodomonas_salina.1
MREERRESKPVADIFFSLDAAHPPRHTISNSVSISVGVSVNMIRISFPPQHKSHRITPPQQPIASPESLIHFLASHRLSAPAQLRRRKKTAKDRAMSPRTGVFGSEKGAARL